MIYGYPYFRKPPYGASICFLISQALTIAFAGRLFWMVGQIIWLSGEAGAWGKELLGFWSACDFVWFSI